MRWGVEGGKGHWRPSTFSLKTGMPLVLRFLCFADVALFDKLKVRSSTSTKALTLKPLMMISTFSNKLF